jgi:hypothetical protein
MKKFQLGTTDLSDHDYSDDGDGGLLLGLAAGLLCWLIVAIVIASLK